MGATPYSILWKDAAANYNLGLLLEEKATERKAVSSVEPGTVGVQCFEGDQAKINPPNSSQLNPASLAKLRLMAVAWQLAWKEAKTTP